MARDNTIVMNRNSASYSQEGGEGGCVHFLIIGKRLMGMCRWMRSHFNDWHRIFNGVTRMGTHIF